MANDSFYYFWKFTAIFAITQFNIPLNARLLDVTRVTLKNARGARERPERPRTPGSARGRPGAPEDARGLQEKVATLATLPWWSARLH